MTTTPYQPLPFDPGPEARAAADAARAEWRADEEDAARQAALAWNHNRTLADVARECMARGDRVTLSAYATRALGFVVEVADDLIAIRNIGSTRIDFHITPTLPMVLTINERAVAEGRQADVSSGGFRGRLLAREAAGEECLLAVIGHAEPLCGRLEIGADFVRVVARLGGETHVALNAVLSLAPRD